MEHLRPHPTEVKEKQNINKKFEFRSRTDAYHYAFNPRDYADIEFSNYSGSPTTIYPGLRYALQYSEKPVIFFTGYDVGPNEHMGVFVRHVVCSLAVKEGDHINIYFFDMRNLKDISPSMQSDMEADFSKFANRPVHIVNAACVDRSKCVYLQRFKGDTEMGWCIGWALLFLDFLTKNPTFLRKTLEGKKNTLAKLYTELDARLSGPRTNHFIETYYIHLMGL